MEISENNYGSDGQISGNRTNLKKQETKDNIEIESDFKICKISVYKKENEEK